MGEMPEDEMLITREKAITKGIIGTTDQSRGEIKSFDASTWQNHGHRRDIMAEAREKSLKGRVHGRGNNGRSSRRGKISAGKKASTTA